jgi:hypothetical protein
MTGTGKLLVTGYWLAITPLPLPRHGAGTIPFDVNRKVKVGRAPRRYVIVRSGASTAGIAKSGPLAS